MNYRDAAPVPKEEIIIAQTSFKEELQDFVKEKHLIHEGDKAFKYLPRVLKKIKKLCIEAAKNGKSDIVFGHYDLPWFTSWSTQLQSLLVSALSNPPYNLHVSHLENDHSHIFIKWNE